METALAGYLNWSAMAGNGREQCFTHFRDSNRFRPIRAIPRTFLTATTSYSKVHLPRPMPVWSARLSETGSEEITRTPTQRSAWWRISLSDFAADVRTGLTARRKELPSKYLYDDVGSALFNAIT